MDNGGTSKDPELLFEEATTTYVGWRAAEWWAALEELSLLTIQVATQDNTDKGKVRAEAVKARSRYDKAMTNLTHGYEGSNPQINTTRPISQSMKMFIDREFLENKIPDQFEKVAKFQQLFTDLML